VRAHKLGRAVYDLRTREQAFDLHRVVTAYPLRGEPEPAGSRATRGPNLQDGSSVDTAQPVPDPLDDRLRAGSRDWTVSLAPLLGDASPSSLWLPLPRVWNSRGVSSGTTRWS
jgi:hypothetical protein